MPIRDWPVDTRPRERLLAGGELSDAELLAVIVGCGDSRRSALAIAQDALVAVGGPAALGRADAARLRGVGLGRATVARVLASCELGRRVLVAGSADAPCDSPGAAAAALAPHFLRRDREVMAVGLLTRKRRLAAVVGVYEGTVAGTPVRIGELFTEALRRNAAAVVLAHNHPSGDPAPSPDDLRTTVEAVGAGRLLGVPVVDHLVFGAGRWISLRERSGISFD